MTAAPTALGRRSAARKPQPEPTAARSAQRGGGLLVLAGSRMRRCTALVSGGALLLAALLLLVSLCVGPYPVPAPEVARALFYGTGDRLAVHFVNQERLPQALLTPRRSPPWSAAARGQSGLGGGGGRPGRRDVHGPDPPDTP